LRRFASVQPPVFPSKAPRRIAPAGRKRKRMVYRKNGTVASQAHVKRLRPDRVSGRRPAVAASVAMVG
jgi:hypothetical protein